VREHGGYTACAVGIGAEDDCPIVGSGGTADVAGIAGVAAASGAVGIVWPSGIVCPPGIFWSVGIVGFPSVSPVVGGFAGISPVAGELDEGIDGVAGSTGGVDWANAAPLTINAAVIAKIFIGRLLVIRDSAHLKGKRCVVETGSQSEAICERLVACNSATAARQRPAHSPRSEPCG